MNVRDLRSKRFKIGDLVRRCSRDTGITFCIIGFKNNIHGERIAILKALFNHTFIVEVPLSDLKNLLVTGKL